MSLVALASLLRPGYSQISEEVSYLGYGSNAILQNLNFVIFGVLTIAVAVGLVDALRSVSGTGATRPGRLLIVFGLAVVVAGVSLMLVDTLPAGVAFLTHTAASFLAFAAVLAAQLAAARSLDGTMISGWKAYGRFSRASGWIGVVLLLVFVGTMFSPVQGLTERVFLAVPFLWMEVTGWQLRSSRSGASMQILSPAGRAAQE